MQSVVRSSLALAAVSLLGACQDGTGPDSLDQADRRAASRAGTTISAHKTSTGFLEHRTEFDWMVEKRVKKILVGEQMTRHPSTTEYHLKPEETIWIYYEIVATRTALPEQLVSGARGTVCVSNDGTRATEGLAIVDVVQEQRGEGFVDVASAPVPLNGQPVLQPGETGCYPYEIAFEARPGVQYRNTARVAISNHEGSLGAPFGPGIGSHAVTADFVVPAEAVTSVTDAEAIIDDGMRADSAAHWWEGGPCAETWYLFQCTSPYDPGTWRVTKSDTITFIVDYYNRAACGEAFDLTNVATLTEQGPVGATPDVRTASASVRITTDPCPAPPGCTLTEGYWKQEHHPWPGANEYDRRSLRHWPFFDSGLSWHQMLNTSSKGGDAYVILAQQYIAATLNIGSDADAPAAVRAARAAAARYFASPPAQRAAYDRATLLEWADLLDRFNNGLLGVPRCD